MLKLNPVHFTSYADVLSANNSPSSIAICVSTIPYTFNSPQQVKAWCFTLCAISLGSAASCIVPIRTNNAAADSPPFRQIISVRAWIFQRLEWLSAFGSRFVSPASARRTSSASHGSFFSSAYWRIARLCASRDLSFRLPALVS